MDVMGAEISVSEPGRGCRRAETADRAAAYVARPCRALMDTGRRVLPSGWEIDFEIETMPGERMTVPDSIPNPLGYSVDAVVERGPEPRLHVLERNGAVPMVPGRILPPLVWGDERIRFALYGLHPFGVRHHGRSTTTP